VTDDAPSAAGLLPRPTRRDRLRWRQLAAVILIGVVVAAIGVIANVALHWTDIWPDVFLTVGSTFALGGVLFVLQRSWVTEVATEVQQAGDEVRNAARIVEERATQIEDELRAHRPISVEELRDLVESSTSSVADNRRTAIQVLRDDLSFDNLAAVLNTAQDLNAIAPGFRVQAASAPTGLRLAIWLVSNDNRGFELEPYIELHVLPIEADAISGDLVEWRRAEPVSDVITELIASCQRANLPSAPPAFDPAEAFRRLIADLESALSIRQSASGPRLRGAVTEMIDEAWTLTSFGLENRFRQIALPLRDFVLYVYNSDNPDETPQKQWSAPHAPEHVNEIEWTYLQKVVSAGLPDNPPPGVRYVAF
jgi:hypothetical protein